MPNSATPLVHRILRRGGPKTGRVDGVARDGVACLTASCPIPSPHPLSLRKNFGWSFLANCVYAASRWVTVVVLAKLGNTEMIGFLLLALAITSPISAIANLGLRTALVTDAKCEYLFRDYFSLRLVTSLLAIIATGLLVLLLGYEPQMTLIIVAVAVGKLFESLSDIIHGLFQQRERMDWVAFSILMREPAIVALLILGVCSTGNLLWGIVGLPAATGMILVCYDLRKARQVIRLTARPSSGVQQVATLPDGLRPSWDFRKMLALARLSTPAGIVAMLISLVLNLPRYLVEHYLGAHALGIFGAINSLAMSPTQLVIAMGSSTSPRLAKYCAAGNTRAFARLVALQMAILAGMGTCGVLLMTFLGRPLLQLLYDAQIAAYAQLAVYLMIGAAILNFNGPLGRALDAMRCFWIHAAVRALSILLLLVLLPPFITTWGLQGAAWAVILSALTSTAAYCSTIGYRLLQSPQARPHAPARGSSPLP